MRDVHQEFCFLAVSGVLVAVDPTLCVGSPQQVHAEGRAAVAPEVRLLLEPGGFRQLIAIAILGPVVAGEPRQSGQAHTPFSAETNTPSDLDGQAKQAFQSMPVWDNSSVTATTAAVVTEISVLCMAAKWGPSVLFCMPNRSTVSYWFQW
jgi:hypothetical protein